MGRVAMLLTEKNDEVALVDVTFTAKTVPETYMLPKLFNAFPRSTELFVRAIRSPEM